MSIDIDDDVSSCSCLVGLSETGGPAAVPATRDSRAALSEVLLPISTRIFARSPTLTP
eukprot:SAG31_NODE_36559_length_312_cov_0.821596_1_plen_57_part_10